MCIRDRIKVIKEEQAQGKIVAMTGDGTNDAPALAQADVGLAMNSGTTAAKEAANMVDLDSDPTKILEVVEIGKMCIRDRLNIQDALEGTPVTEKYLSVVGEVKEPILLKVDVYKGQPMNGGTYEGIGYDWNPRPGRLH